MQLELAFLERPTASAARMEGPSNWIDPQAQIAALDILSRLIAQMLAAGSALETSNERIQNNPPPVTLPVWPSSICASQAPPRLSTTAS